MTFNNIFDRRKEEKISKLHEEVIIDNREKNTLIPSILSKNKIPYKFEQLEVGDYIIKDTIIERKTINDLKSSIINKRLFTQLNNLREQNNKIIIIEGNFEDLTNNEILHENALRGAILSISLKERIPIIFSKGEEDTYSYIELLARKRKSSPESSIRPSRKTLSIQEKKQFILEGFTNIGPTTAKKLIEKHKSLKKIFNAEEQELKDLLGKRANDFLDLLNDESN